MSTSKKAGSPEETAERSMKGWTVVPKKQSNAENVDARTNRDSVMPSIDTLKEKFFGSTVKVDSAAPGVDDKSTANVVVESGPLKKAVGVSNGKVLWRQG
jgi:hypothetical protein